MGQLLLPRSRQQSLPSGGSTHPSAAPPVAVRQTQTAGFRNRAVSGGPVARGVWSGPACIADCQPSVGDNVSLLREPDAVTPPVRLDERDGENGQSFG